MHIEVFAFWLCYMHLLFSCIFASETVGCMLGIFQQQTERNLKHYEHDSLKLEAAKFLIRNMPIVL